MNIMDLKRLVKLIHEIGNLKNIPRSGWLKIGIKNPESVAEHSFRTAIIAFFIAYLETRDVEKACKATFLALIHDIHESRTLDLHKLAKRYVKIKDEPDQLSLISSLLSEIEDEELKKFVRDADKLELLFQAKEYSEFINSAMVYVKKLEFESSSAKKIAEVCKKTDHRWWLDFE